MGCDVEFFAFREEPDISKLEKIKWLPAWRLFKQADKSAWYLEGPAQGEEITFFEPLHLHSDSPPVTKAIDAQVQAIIERIEQEGGDRLLFDDWSFRQCAALSRKLEQAVLFAGGNDEGFDGFFVFDSGALVEAKFDIDWYKAVMIGPDGSISIDQFFEPDADQEKLAPRFENQSACEGAAAFFGAENWTVTSDPYEFEAGQYRLVAQKGEAPPVNVRLSHALYKQFGGMPKPGDLLEAIAPYVDTALSKELVYAENEERFASDKHTSELSIYLGNCREKPAWRHRHLMHTLKGFLSNLSGYTLALRPRPDFRKDNAGLEQARRSLARRWNAIKLESRILN